MPRGVTIVFQSAAFITCSTSSAVGPRPSMYASASATILRAVASIFAGALSPVARHVVEIPADGDDAGQCFELPRVVLAVHRGQELSQAIARHRSGLPACRS